MIRFSHRLLATALIILVASLSGVAQEPQRFPSPFKVEPPKTDPYFVPPSPFKVEPKPLSPPVLDILRMDKPIDWDAELKRLGTTPSRKLTPLEEEIRRLSLPLSVSKAERVMDTKSFPKERALLAGWKGSFPKLGTDFEVLGECTAPAADCRSIIGEGQKIFPGSYNCIAHAAGIKNLWVNPFERVAQWEAYFKPLGYALQATNSTQHEVGVQKVAVYGKLNAKGQIAEYTHAAIQEGDGTWTSKLGSGPLIRHRTAEAVNGPSYGEVVRVFVRKAPAK